MYIKASVLQEEGSIVIGGCAVERQRVVMSREEYFHDGGADVCTREWSPTPLSTTVRRGAPEHTEE